MAIHDLAIRNLTPTDYLLIEDEHNRLKRFLGDLHDTCCNLDNLLNCQSCSKEKFASCRGRLPSFFLDLMDIVDKHFYHEEAIMLNRPNITEDYEYFRNHSHAHAKILLELSAIIRKCVAIDKLDTTAESYRQFFQNISDLFEAHDRDFDDPFIQSTKT
ncbi:MAG: hypothetical protein HOP04_05445 [Methylophilaceae bacterium]|nr:hypothetical protein [Methylophilaceae bacterium]